MPGTRMLSLIKKGVRATRRDNGTVRTSLHKGQAIRFTSLAYCKRHLQTVFLVSLQDLWGKERVNT